MGQCLSEPERRSNEEVVEDVDRVEVSAYDVSEKTFKYVR